MFIFYINKNSNLGEKDYSQLNYMGISFKKELFTFGGGERDVIVIVKDYEEGDIQCACKILSDTLSYKIENISYKKQLALIYCMEWIRSSIIIQNINYLKNNDIEIQIHWNDKLLKDVEIFQLSTLVDINPGEQKYYTLNRDNYYISSGNNIDHLKEKKAFQQSSYKGFDAMPNKFSDPFKFANTDLNKIDNNTKVDIGLNKIKPFNLGENQENGIFGKF